MVFVLDDIGKIEADRDIFSDGHKSYIYTHKTNSFTEELKHSKFFIKILKDYYKLPTSIDVYDVFIDAVLNAGIHGNLSERGKKINIEIKDGSKGNVIYVTNEGNLFNYRMQIGLLQSGYSHFHKGCGLGMRRFNECEQHISYHDWGRKILE